MSEKPYLLGLYDQELQIALQSTGAVLIEEASIIQHIQMSASTTKNSTMTITGMV